MGLEDLYQELILDHYRRPRNRGALGAEGGGVVRSAALVNPLCGDEIAVALRLVEPGGRIADCRFEGVGCSYSIASASLMTERLKGRTIGDARELVREFKAMMRGEGSADYAEPPQGSRLGDLVALRGVVQFPVRIKCATLAWDALDHALSTPSPGPP